MIYTYPDAEYWIQYLEPVEATYLILYTGITSKHSKEVLTSSSVVSPGFDRNGNLRTFEIDDESSSTIDGGDLSLGFNGNVTVEISADYSGHFTPYISATYMDPAEGGESILTEVDVTSVTYWGPVDEDLELTPEMFAGKDYTYKDLYLCAEEVVEQMIDASESEVESSGKISHPKGLPASIVKSIEKVRTENKRAINIAKSKKTYGL